MINLFPCLSRNGWKICQTFPSEWEGYILPTVKMMMNLLICSWKLEFNLEQSCLFPPRYLFFHTGLHKSGLPPMARWIYHWAQDILIRYAFASPCRSWMLSLRPIFLPAVWVNQFELLQSESVSLSDHKIGWSNGGEANQPWERLGGISDDLSLTIRALRWVAPVVFKSQLPVRHNRIYSNSSQLHCKTVLVLGYCM